MGKRREPRKPFEATVRIFGTDSAGRIFSENVTVFNISRHGAHARGVKAQLNLDEIVGLTFEGKKVHFRVKWIGKPGTPSEGEVGLLNLTPEKPLWPGILPAPVLDNFKPESLGDRRRSTRIKCAVSVEIRPEGGAAMWGKASDLSAGGCFVEMPIPLPVGTKFEIALWISGTKLRLAGSVVSAAPGYGIGIRFQEVSAQDVEILNDFIQNFKPV